MEVKGFNNLITQPLYDTVQLPVGVGTQHFFINPITTILAGAARKTYAHTNLVQAGRLEKGIKMTITGISMYIRDIASGGNAVTFADYQTVFNNSHLNFLIGQVSFLRLPLQNVPPGSAETQYFSNLAPAVTEYKVNHGAGNIFNIFQLDNPLILDDQESIDVEVSIGTALVAVTDLTIVLHGQQTRPVR